MGNPSDPSDPSIMSELIIDCSWDIWKRKFDIGYTYLVELLVGKLTETKVQKWENFVMQW